MTDPRLRADDENLDEQISSTFGVILPGGKLDTETIRRLAAEAAERGEDDEELRRLTFRLRRDLGKRLDRYLTDRITFMSRNQLQKLIAEGGVQVNGRTPKSSTTLHKGDVIEVVVPPPPATEIQPENIPLEVMYEDDDIIVINKTPDIIVHPARAHNRGTMVNALAWHFRHVSGGALSSVGTEFARPGVVHRLDRHTSGVIVFAKRDEAHWKLGHQFQRRTVDKRYLAVVHGRIEPDVQVIDLPLGPSRSKEKGYREKYCVRHDAEGREAVTICRVRERYGPGVEGPNRDADGTTRRPPHLARPQPPELLPGARAPQGCHSLVELELKTGRTHQIRVHLSYLGWPIVGDDMYGGRPFEAGGRAVIERQALHAAILAFDHPITGRRLRFTAPLRGDMAALIRHLRTGPVTRPDSPGTSVELDAALGG